MFLDEYQTIQSLTEDSITDRGSLFIAAIAPVESQQAVDELVDAQRSQHPDGREWVVASKIGLPDDVTTYEDGEGKFSRAILALFDSMQLTNIAAIVHRDSTGKASGTQSYHDAVLNAIQHGKVVKKILYASLRFEVSPADMNLVSRLIIDGRAKITHTQTGNPNIITVMIRKIQEDELTRSLTTKVNGRVRRIDNK